MNRELVEASQAFIKGSNDFLLKQIIKEVEEEANNAKVLKETADETAMNLSYQIGRIEGAYAILKKINTYANHRS